MIKTLILVLTMAVYGHLGGNHVYEYMESRWACPKDSSVEKIAKGLDKDGSWPDIDYSDRNRGIWKLAVHAQRMRELASYCHYHPERVDIMDSFLSALRWWCARYPQCPNWWWNEVAMPYEFGLSGLWLRDYLSKEDYDALLVVVDQNKAWRTGQNKVWSSRNWFIKGLLTDDEALVKQCRDSLVSEIVVTDREGIQPDWSYHQHGPQMQFGNYGLSYAAEMVEWIKVFEGTGLDIEKEQQDIIYNYINEGLRWLIWNGYFDFSGCGRQVTEGSQKSKAGTAMEAMRKLGIEDAPAGAKYYPCSDFGIYRTNDWYASIRMNSNRTTGYEHTNKENMLGRFTADGAMLVRRSGDEYSDICVAWDWRHIPGVTSYDDGASLLGTPGEKAPFNKSDLVFGKIQGDIMVAAMDYNRKGLRARKTWVFFPEGILCLGAGISLDPSLDWRIHTAVNQCKLSGPVESGKNWVRHNGISYVFLDGNKYKLAPREHKGRWYDIHPAKSKDIVTMQLFDLYTDHGNCPQNASYAYLVMPGDQEGKESAKYAKRNVIIKDNTDILQKALVGGVKVSVDWQKGEIIIDK